VSDTDETIGRNGRPCYQYILAIGSNMGDRYENFVQALDLLFAGRADDDDDGAHNNEDHPVCRSGRVSFLYETAPMYVTDQAKFLNGAVEVDTSLEPHDLLLRLKAIEARMGRDFETVRNGPRPIDLDILLYRRRRRRMDAPSHDNDDEFDHNDEYLRVDTPDLTIPHPRINERDFVLAPLIDLLGADATIPTTTTAQQPDNVMTLRESLALLTTTTSHGKGAANDHHHFPPSVVRVVPIPRGRFLRFNRTLIMGILNVTPDSFSDGGQWTATTNAAVQRGLAMAREGADIIDIGGESTRPGAVEVSIDEELRRTIPVIQGIRKGTRVVLIKSIHCDK
jgi:2-amino-4-hydroxy-6-hydroxymethyldihydropteridine diphosphokinase